MTTILHILELIVDLVILGTGAMFLFAAGLSVLLMLRGEHRR